MKETGRNDPCPCGSGKKYKQCCQQTSAASSRIAAAAIPAALQAALEHHRAGRLPQARAIYRQILEADPHHADALHYLGAIASHEGKHQDAAELIGRAIRIRPSRTMHYNLGNALKALGDLDGAAENYRKALALKPDYAEAHVNLGNVLQAQGRLDEAAGHYRSALLSRPDLADAHVNLGNALKELGRLDEAIASFQRALALRPDLAETHFNLGQVFTSQDKPDAAILSYRKALALRPDYGEALNSLGLVIRAQGNLDEAVACYRKALALKPDFAEAHINLGNILKDLGRLGEAEASYQQAIQINPDIISARFNLASIRKVKTGDENLAALEALAEALQNGVTSLPDKDAVYLHFALGKRYDDIGDYEKAFPHFLEGCRLKRTTFNHDPDQDTQLFTGIMCNFDAATIDRLRGGNPSRLPIFVLGMPRSGTTLTEQIIASHPEVHGAGELPDVTRIAWCDIAGVAFPDYLRLLDKTRLGAWGAEYAAGLQQHAPVVRHITDKMPENFFFLGLIHLMLPNARIIHVNRNPVDTCLSCFTTLFKHQHEHTYDLAELGRYYANYARLMEHWRRVLPEGAFLDVQYEDIVADQEAQSRRIIEYCGLEWNDACLGFHRNKRPVGTASATQVRQPMYQSSVERWRHYEKFLGPLLDALGELVPDRKDNAR